MICLLDIVSQNVLMLSIEKQLWDHLVCTSEPDQHLFHQKRLGYMGLSAIATILHDSVLA